MTITCKCSCCGKEIPAYFAMYCDGKPYCAKCYLGVKR